MIIGRSIEGVSFFPFLEFRGSAASFYIVALSNVHADFDFDFDVDFGITGFWTLVPTEGTQGDRRVLAELYNVLGGGPLQRDMERQVKRYS